MVQPQDTTQFIPRNINFKQVGNVDRKRPGRPFIRGLDQPDQMFCTQKNAKNFIIQPADKRSGKGRGRQPGVSGQTGTLGPEGLKATAHFQLRTGSARHSPTQEQSITMKNQSQLHPQVPASILRREPGTQTLAIPSVHL